MKTNPDNHDESSAASVPSEAPSDAAADLSRQSEAAADLPSPAQHRHRNGKIARLPKEVRTQINHQLDDGVEFSDIRDQLGVHAAGITVAHIGSWKRGGYQDHLQEERRRDECRLRNELFKSLAADDAGIETYQASPKIAVALASEALLDLGPETLR